jgi:hypothetical protein
MNIRLNLNTQVTVRLTERGRAKMLASRWIDTDKIPPVGEPYVQTLWVLMNVLGPSMSVGSDAEFVGNCMEIPEAGITGFNGWERVVEVPPPFENAEPYTPDAVVTPGSSGGEPKVTGFTNEYYDAGWFGHQPSMKAMAALVATMDTVGSDHNTGIFDFPAPAPQGCEDTPYDRGFADGKKQRAAEADARAVSDTLRRACNAPITSTHSCSVGTIHTFTETNPDGTRTRTTTETVKPGEPFRSEMERTLERERQMRVDARLAAAEEMAKAVETHLLDPNAHWPDGHAVDHPSLVDALAAYRSVK